MFKSIRVSTSRVFNKKSKPKFVKNQRTILGYLLSLMEGQKVAVALVHLRKEDASDIIIPIGFKIDETKIPVDLHPMKFHPSNLIDLSVEGCAPINVMIVAIGDDSQELIPIYAGFCVKMEKFKSKVGRFEEKINHWINIESLKMDKPKKQVLQVVEEKDLDIFLNRIDILKRRENAKTSQEMKAKDRKVIDIESTSSDSSEDRSDYEDEIVNRNSRRRDSLYEQSLNRKDRKKIPDREIVQQSLEKMKNIINHPKSDPSGRIFMNETFNILDFLVKHNDLFDSVELYQSFSNDPDDLRFLSEEDPTKRNGENILLEGILPLPIVKYKSAIKCKNCKQDEFDFGAAAIITNLIRYTFPDHWIDNVTLRGSGGRMSLIRIWDHRDPHQFPLQDPIENGLGEARFRALLDHSIRISGRKSYDKAAEKVLVSALSKAMHYARTKLVTMKKSNKCENFFELKENIKFESKLDRRGKLISGAMRIHPPVSTFFEDLVEKDVSSDDEETVSDIMKPKRNFASSRILDDPEDDEPVKNSKGRSNSDEFTADQAPDLDDSSSHLDISSSSKKETNAKKSPIVVLTNLEILKEQAIQSESSGYVDADSLQYEKSPRSSPIYKSTPKRKFDELEKNKEKDIPCEFEVNQVDDFVPLTQSLPSKASDDYDSQSNNKTEGDEELSDTDLELLSKLQKKKKLFARFMAKMSESNENEEN